MHNFLESSIDEYVSSQHFLFLDPLLKEHALSLLFAFSRACPGAGITSPDSVSVDKLERVLTTHLSRLDVPFDVRKSAPLLIEAFFDFLDASGHQPGAALWAGWIRSLTPGYQARFRDDGSLRGETFVKKYSNVNRNEPCPCGSGKKFKKCCMRLLDSSDSGKDNR